MKERLEIVRRRARDLLRRLAALRRHPEGEPPPPHEEAKDVPDAHLNGKGKTRRVLARLPAALPPLSVLRERAVGLATQLARTARRKPTSPPEPGEEHVPPAPKLPPELPLFFMLSHLEEDGPVRLDNVKVGVCEVMGMEIDEPKLGAFAGALNALDFPVPAAHQTAPPAPGTATGEAS